MLQKTQEWLDKCCPKQKRNSKKYLYINGKGLEGILGLSDFINLEELYCANNNLTNLYLNNCSKLKKVDCANNCLTELTLAICSEIIYLNCSNNYLTNLDFLVDLKDKKLEKLSIQNNNFSSINLTTFSRFSNLKELYLGNSDPVKVNQGIYNRFTGSLESLEKITELEFLNIDNTDIDKGLKCLPDSVKKIYCSTDLRIDSKVREIKKLLDGAEENSFSRHFQSYFHLGEFATSPTLKRFKGYKEKIKELEEENKKRGKAIEVAETRLTEKNRMIKELKDLESFSAYLNFNEFSQEYAQAMEDFYRRQGINTGDYQEHLSDYTFFKQFKERISKEFLELNWKNNQNEQKIKELENTIEIIVALGESELEDKAKKQINELENEVKQLRTQIQIPPKGKD